MDCDICAGKGLVTLNWADAPPEYAVCLCQQGLAMRVTRDGSFALWEVWAAREGVDPSRVWRLEDVLTPEELRERGVGQPVEHDAVSAIAEAARAKNAKARR
jgi:hypothetical protein